MDEKHTRDFKGIWIPKEIWLNRELSLPEKILFAEIHSLSGNEGCFASNEYFSEFLGISIRQMLRSLAILKKKNLVSVKSFDGRTRVLCCNMQQNISEVNKSSCQNRRKRHSLDDASVMHINKSIDKNIENTLRETRDASSREDSGKTEEHTSQIQKPFSWPEYVDKLIDDNKRHIQLIGYYFREKGISFDSREKANAAITRHLRAAKLLVPFDEKELEWASNYCKTKYSEIDWTLETMLKILSSRSRE